MHGNLCLRIKSMHKRYAKNYGIDLIQNELDARANMDEFLAAQLSRFICPHCEGVIDQHHRKCSSCGAEA